MQPESPYDEGWIPPYVSDGTSIIDIQQRMRLECRECTWSVTVPKQVYKHFIAEHQEAHRNDG